MVLSAERVTRFAEEGFFIVEDLMTNNEVEALLQQIEGIAEGRIEFPAAQIEFDPGADPNASAVDRLRKINEASRHNSVFLEHARNPKLLDVVEGVLGPDLKLFGDQLFVKPPGGIEKTYHQDSPYFKIEPMALVSSWVALDEVTVENGCLYVVPGSHKGGPQEHSDVWMVGDRQDMKIPDAAIDLERELPVELSKGSVSFHHSLLMHRSGANNTQTRRRGLATHFMSSQSKWTGESADKPEYPLLRGRKFSGCV